MRLRPLLVAVYPVHGDGRLCDELHREPRARRAVAESVRHGGAWLEFVTGGKRVVADLLDVFGELHERG